MAKNAGGKRLMNRSPRWVRDAIQHLTDHPPNEAKPTSFFITFTYEWREERLDDYAELRYPPRDWDNTANDMAALLRRFGWTNLKAGTGRAAMWELS